MFGSAAKTPFGGGSTFGTGTTAFGAQSTQATASPFGQTSAAGATGGGLFGSTNTQTSGFGTFGQAQQTGTGLFGGSTNTGTGTSLFGGGGGGGTTTGGLFGQQAGTKGFGTTGTTGSIFGGNPSSTGSSLFGQSSTFNAGTSGTFGGTGSLFGTPSTSTTSSGLFGGGTTQQQSSLFGGTSGFQSAGFGSQATAQAGTPLKFAVVTGTDQMVKNGITTTVSTRHQSITVMKEYEGKSFEELRFEDYSLGRKKGASGTGGLFQGSTATTTATSTGGLFGGGTSNFSAFGQPKTGFGTTGGGTGLFGQPTQTSTGGLFSSKPAGGLFGTNTTSTATSGFGTSAFGTPASGGLFGQTSSTGQTGGLFGTATTAQTGGLFGGGTAGFGQPTSSASTGLFGQTGFGTTAQTGLFNNKLGTTTTGFGTSTGTSLFGANNQLTKPVGSTGFGGLGSTTAFGAGATNTGTSLFGKPAFGATGTLGTSFGTGTTGTGLFGGGTSGLGTGLGSLGGTTAFGTTTLGQGSALNLGGTSTLLGNQSNALLQQQQQLQLQQQILALNNSPFGNSKLFRNSLIEKPKGEKAVTNTTASSKVMGSPSHYKVSSKLTAKIKPRPINNHTMNKLKLFEGLDDEVGLSPDTFVPRKSIKKLVIRNRNGLDQDSPLTSGGLQLRTSDEEETEIRSAASSYHFSPQKASALSNGTAHTPSSSTRMSDANKDSASPMGVRFSRGREKRLDDTLDDLNVHQNHSVVKETEKLTDEIDGEVDDGPRLEPCGIILTRPEYYTKPSIPELNEMIDENGEIWVVDFVVGRAGYGEVKFLGKTNVADLNLDEIVFFRRREIEVYPDSYPDKPPVGEELNKKAEITLLKVWPNDKTTHQPIKTPERLKLQGWLEKVEAATSKLDACFIDYRPETGTWVFTVEHFTKYGIHEFLDDESTIKKLKRPPVDMETIKTKETQEAIDQEKLAMLQKLKEQQAKLDAYEQEKERIAESMQDQDSDEDNLENQAFPDEEFLDEEDMNESPASHQLTTALGVSAHRMQVMKASFFGESEPSVPSPQPKEKSFLVKSLLSGSFDERSQRSSLPLGPMLSPKVVRHSDLTGQTTQQSSTTLFRSPKIGYLPQKYPVPQAVASDTPPTKIMLPSAIGSAFDRGTKLVGARAKQRDLVPKERSITDGKENHLADFGLVMGRSFRVGWGPGFVLVHGGIPLGMKTEKTSALVQSSHTGDTLFSKSRLVSEAQEGRSPFGVVIERMNIAEHLKQDNESGLLQHLSSLEVELEHSKSSTSKDGCPFFEPFAGTKALHHHAKMVRKNKESLASGPLHESAEHMSLVWDLAVALWGQLTEDEEEKDEEISEDRDSYQYHLARREALSRWLFNAARDRVKTDVDRANFEESNYLGAIWSHVTGRQISEACRVAQQHRDHRLALLLSQATGNATVKNLLQKQLSVWEQLKADDFITEQRIKILALLAGCMVWRTSSETVNACERLDWKRTLAVHMWYQNTPTSSIQDVLTSYEDSFKGRTSYGQYGTPPNPPYREEDDEGEDNEVAGHVRDTCYHLLKLYCKRSHRLERAIAPATYTCHQLDYRQSWHLSQALQSIGYSHLSSYHAGLLHSSFAAQLEALGLWEWAAFVLLHMSDKPTREHAVRSLLCRHCQLSTAGDYVRKEQFLKEKLLIPAEWIHEAKAIRAFYLDLPHDEAVHLLKSHQWSRGHQVILTKIASDAIINEEFGSLQSLLLELEPRERSSTVKDWASGGLVLLDFLKVTEKFKAITEGSLEPTKYNFEEIHMQVSSLCTRINHLPSTTAKDRLCQYELAKQCANYLKVATSELGDLSLEEDTPLPSHVIVPHISKLPLPEDCALAELRDLTASYISEITANT